VKNPGMELLRSIARPILSKRIGPRAATTRARTVSIEPAGGYLVS
jgi:hypothetical protein